MTVTRIENHKYTMGEAFKQCFYVVPDYQREYVWTDKQVSQLLEDIDKEIDDNSSQYFIGNIIVSPREDGEGHFDVIDGQQRLTTTFLILCALRVLFSGNQHSEMIKNITTSSYTDIHNEIKTSLKLDPQYENAGEILKRIAQDNSEPEAVRARVKNSDIPYQGSVEKILNAYAVVYRFLQENYDDEAKLKNYWGHLARNVVFFQISTDVSSALKIFETINDRGVSLSPMDLLKNLLFRQVPKKDFSRLKDGWKKITSKLEKAKEKPLRFLRYFIVANYETSNEYKTKSKRKDVIVREDEIYDWFSDEGNATLTGYQKNPFEFVRRINRNVDFYIRFSKGYDNRGEASLSMGSLKTLTGGAFSLHYILLLAAVNLPQSFFNHFVAQLESFLFYYIFTKTQSKEVERNFSIWADEVRDIACVENREKQRERLNAFIDKRFSANMQNKANELEDALNRLTLESMQKYRIRYLLARLTQHVDMAFKGQKKRGSLDAYLELEIEHILPNNPKDDLRSKWQMCHPDLPYDDMKIRFGNLTLLEKPINIVVGNKFYKEKVSEYTDSAHYLTRSLSGLADVGQNTSISRINEKLCSFSEWKAKDIEKRQRLLIELCKEVWKTTEIVG